MTLNNDHITLLKRILTLGGWNIDTTLIRESLLSHPNYPSLQAFVDTIKFLGIPHEAYITDYPSLLKINKPILLHLKVQEGAFAILLSANDKEVTLYIAESNKSISIPKEFFLKQWSGIVLIIEKKPAITKRMLPSLYLLIGVIFSILLLLFFSQFSIQSIASIFALGINTIGFISSLFIVNHELGKNSSISRSICHLTEKTDCDAVLSSPASKIWNTISLGDIGLVYFSSCILILLILPLLFIPQSYICSLFLLSICTLPYTLFSLYYQQFKIKKWCPFCLLCLFMLWGTFICYYFMLSQIILSIYSLYLFVLIFGVISFVWITIKPYLKSEEKRILYRIESLKLKRTPQIFSLFINAQQQYNMAFDRNDILIGNSSSSITITLLISEKCIYCKKIVNEILEYIQECQSKIKWIIRFGDINPSKGDKPFFFYFYYLYHNQNEDLIRALKDWADDMDQSLWLSKYDLPLQPPPCPFFNEKKEWLLKNGFQKTPIIFLNNREMPDVYRISDLAFLFTNDDIVSIITD